MASRIAALALVLLGVVSASPYAMLESWASVHMHTGSQTEMSTARALGMSVQQLRLAHKQLMQQREKLKVGLPSCGGLVSSLCQSCANGGPGEFCEGANKACGEIFCYPFCLRQTWTCKVDFGSMEKEAEDERYGKALCGQFMAQGCAEMLQCCDNDEKLYQWVEDHVWSTGAPGQPTPFCEHDPKTDEGGKLCGKCNGEVNVELEAQDCPYPDIAEEDAGFVELASGEKSKNKAAVVVSAEEMAEPELSEEEKAHVDALTLTELALEIKRIKQRMDSKGTAVASSSISASSSSSSSLTSQTIAKKLSKRHQRKHVDSKSATSSSSSSASASLPSSSPSEIASVLLEQHQQQKAIAYQTAHFRAPWDAGPPKHKSLKYRCSKLKTAVEGAIGGMQSAFKAKACECMGCCEGDCYFKEKERV